MAFGLDVAALIEEAYERLSVDVQTLTAGHFETARRSLNLILMTWSMRHWTSWAIVQYEIITSAGIATYPLPLDTVGLLTEPVLAISPTETQQASTQSLEDWQTLPDADQVSYGRPTASILDRRGSPYRLNVWPPPDGVYTIRGWRIRRLRDAEDAGDDIDIPPLWTHALASDLALALFFKQPVAARDAALRQDLLLEQALAARAVGFDNAEPQSWWPAASRCKYT